MRFPRTCVFALTFLAASVALAGGTREGKGGWIIVRLQGDPHEIGFQHGALLAHEIADALAAEKLESAGPKDWTWYRETAHRMFWPKLDKEYQDEISAIAEGARSKGSQVDADDILALNSTIELGGYYLPYLQAKEKRAAIVSHAPESCSAFVATGSETADGKVVMGHNFWWSYLTGERWNVIFDIKPTKGHEFMMDAMPGLIESGSDWALNNAGIAFCETTISGFAGFDESGVPEFQRMRKAIQYSESLDDVARIFAAGNNGGYANTWLMADANTQEIGKLELGLRNVIFSRCRDGYYFGANFPEDPKLMVEEAPGYRGSSEGRKKRWREHLDGDKGKVSAEIAKAYLGDSYDEDTHQNDGHGGALCGKGGMGGAINAKVLTADMAHRMQFWARMGVPDGTVLTFANMPEAKRLLPILHDVQPNDWVVIAGTG